MIIRRGLIGPPERTSSSSAEHMRLSECLNDPVLQA